MMNTNAIFEKYWDALKHASLAEGNISRSTIAMALHLAIEDAALGASQADEAALVDDRDSWRALAGGFQADVADLRQKLTTIRQERDDQTLRIVMLEARAVMQHSYEEQQNRLMRWLIDNEPEASLACDADQGVAGATIDILERQRQTIANYDTALSHAQNEAAMLRQQRADLQAELDILRQEREQAEELAVDLQRRLDATNATAASVDPTPTPDWGPSHPAWQALTAEEQETVTKLASGNIRFRNVAKARRMILIGQVLRHIGSGSSKITMAQYNSQRPAWMAEATSITQYVESNKWQDVVTVALIDTASR